MRASLIVCAMGAVIAEMTFQDFSDTAMCQPRQFAGMPPQADESSTMRRDQSQPSRFG